MAYASHSPGTTASSAAAATAIGRCRRGTVVATPAISRTNSSAALTHSASSDPVDTAASSGDSGHRYW